MVKKVISLSLVAALSTQSFAGTALVDNGVLGKALSNYTPSASYKATDAQGNQIKTMYYSGGFYYRFMNGANAEPLWNVSPPQIEAGCNGLNIKGMFVSILGLDQFGAMLQNAGASLAWGIAIGLIYSLPGVAAAFKMINQWASDIQKLLGMACGAGIAIGKSIADKVGKEYEFDKAEKALTSSFSASDKAKVVQEGANGMFKNGLGLDIDFDWDSGFNYAGKKEATPEKKKEALSGALGNLFGDYSLGGAILNEYLTTSAGTTFLDEIKNQVQGEKKPLFFKKIVINYDGVSSDYKDETFYRNVNSLSDKFVTEENKNSLGLKLLAYTLFYNLVGDVGIARDKASNTIGYIGDVFECSQASAQTKCTNGMSQSDANKKLLDQMTNPRPMAENSVVGKIGVISPNDLKTFIMDGKVSTTDASGNSAAEFAKPLLSPTFLVIGSKERSDNTNNFLITATSPLESEKFFGSKTFGGAKMISACSLYKTLKNKVKEDYIVGLQFVGSQQVDCSQVPTVMFDTNIEIYTDILAKATPEEITTGVAKLSDINAYLLSKAILNQLSSMLYASKLRTEKMVSNGVGLSKDAGATSENSTQMLLDLLNKFAETVKETEGKIRNDFPGADKGVEDVKQYFDVLKQNIKQRNAQMLSSQNK